jgi:hypothetical protein
MDKCWRSFFYFCQKSSNDNLGWGTVGVAKCSYPKVWHNSLVKLRSNLHQESWERHIIMFIPSTLENFHLKPLYVIYLFIYLFTLPPKGGRRWQRSPDTHICTWRGLRCQVVLPNRCNSFFSYFAKIRWILSWDSKLLELLLGALAGASPLRQVRVCVSQIIVCFNFCRYITFVMYLNMTKIMHLVNSNE